MNRSEELCKLLGIEPQRLIKYSIGDDIFTIQDSTNKVNNVYLEIADRSPINGRYVTLIKESNIYPDLTKPSNFVQLLKIHPKGTSSFFHKCEDFIHSIYGVKSLEDDIIGTIIDKLFPSLTTRHKNLAKQQAQATKWDY